MTSLQHQGAQDIAIARLRVRGDKRTALTLARELEQASWPLQLPASAQNAWVMVRELRVSGKPQSLRQQSAEQLDSLLTHAVAGSNANNNAAAVRFASLPELLVFLLRDLGLGQAAGKWYWQRWSYLLPASREQAIAQLLCENLAVLPAVVEHLAAIGQLRLVWRMLSSSTAATIVKQLAQHYGIAVSTIANNANSAHILDINSPVEQQLQHAATRQFQQQTALFARWLPVLEPLPEGDQRWQLAALISGISHCPLLVMRSPKAVVTAFIQHLQPKSGLERDLNLQARLAYKPFDLPTTATADEAAPSQLATPTPQQAPVLVDSAVRNPEAKTNSKASHAQLDMGVVSLRENNPVAPPDAPFLLPTNVSQNVATLLQQHSDTIDEDNPKIPPISRIVNPNFITQSGGFFYLINALRPLLTTGLLATQSLDTLSPTLASGWLWLLDCARLLAEREGIELDQPLLRFIAQIIGCNNPAELLETPPSPQAQNLFAQLEQRLAGKRFWQDKSLLTCWAQVTADASHIDVFYSLNAVRLDIRLAGLDVNPGWAPWLGRVVTFHYSESLNFGAIHTIPREAKPKDSLEKKPKGSSEKKQEGSSEKGEDDAQ